MADSLVDNILAALQPYDLKWNRNRTEGRCNSPLRPGSNSHAFCITLDADAGGGGLWHDKVAGEGGNFITLAPLLPGFVAPTVRAPATPETTTAYNGVDDYAQAQGVPGDVLRAAGWRKGTHYCPQTRRERVALLFDTTTGTRARFIDGLKPKYMSPKGYQRSWYQFEEALQIAEAAGQALVICNGEASALVAQHWGVAATAITGGGENGIPDALLDELQASYQGPIIICLDSDEAGRRGSAKMLATLCEAGYEVRAVDLKGEKGFDLANFTKLHQGETPAALLALDDLPKLPPITANADVTRLQQQVEHLQGIIVDQQRELEAVKARQRWQNDLIRNDKIGASDKITILVTYAELAVQERKTPEPETPRPVNFTALAERAGQSADTIGRCIKKFKGIAWERHEVKTIDANTGQPRTQVRLVPLPALEQPEAIQPAEPRKHGGNHPKKICIDCGSDDLAEERRIICRSCGCQQGETAYKAVNDPEPVDETPEAAAPVPQVAALKNEVLITLEHTVTPVRQLAAQAPEAAAPDDPPTGSNDYRPLPSWLDLQLHQADVAEAEGKHERAAFLRRVVAQAVPS